MRCWNLHSTLLLVLGTAVILVGASSGSCPMGLSKVDAPVDATGGTDLSVFTQCESFNTFQTTVEPVYERQCLNCHGLGGKGAAKFLLALPTTGGSGAAANFAVSMSKLLPDDAGNVEANLLLEKVNGTLTHDINLGETSQDYASMHDWVAEERANPCVAAGDLMAAPTPAATNGSGP